PELRMGVVETANAKAEAEARARAEAEQRAFAESIERQEAEWGKAQAERMVERLTGDLARSQVEAESSAKKDKVAIAFYAGAAVVLFFALILIIFALIRSL
ncbi:MAG: hypothetical protein ACREAB_16670, partial [Blastocatellia bacterium]